MRQSTLFSVAKSRLVLHYPFFGILALHTPEMEDTSIPTVGVDGSYLRVNPKFLEDLQKDEKCNDEEFERIKMGIMAHECLHLALSHVCIHRKGLRDPLIWNIAADFVVNNIILKEGMKLPKKGCFDTKYENMNVEEVYNDLIKQAKKFPAPMMEDLLKNNNGDGNDGKDGKDSNGKNQSSGSCKKSQEEISKELEKKWKEITTNAAMAAKMQGNLPSDIERLMDELLNPKLPWNLILDNFLQEIIKNDYDGLVYDRRFITTNPSFYLPELYNTGVKIAIGIDTSGSITMEMVKEFFSEVVSMLNNRKISEMKLMSCDTEIHTDVTLIPPNYTLPDKLGGCGGTSFKPIFERLAKDDFRPVCLIVFTDLYGDFPDEAPNYPVLWISSTTNVKVPFGQLIYYPLENAR